MAATVSKQNNEEARQNTTAISGAPPARVVSIQRLSKVEVSGSGGCRPVDGPTIPERPLILLNVDATPALLRLRGPPRPLSSLPLHRVSGLENDQFVRQMAGYLPMFKAALGARLQRCVGVRRRRE